MIVLVILAIIVAVAYPGYQNYTRQARRADAHIGLTNAAAQQERFMTVCSNHYAQNLFGNPRACGTAPAFNDGNLGLNGLAAGPVFSPDRHYVLTLVAPTAACPIASCFILQATPATAADCSGATCGSGRQVGDGNFRITSTGIKTWAKDGANYNFRWTDK